jgi:hypothetical protein
MLGESKIPAFAVKLSLLCGYAIDRHA